MSMESTRSIEEEAASWLIRRDSGSWTADDAQCLEAWLSASSLNRVAFLRLELAWEESARLKALAAGIKSDRSPPVGQWNLTPFFKPARFKMSRLSATTNLSDASSIDDQEKAIGAPAHPVSGYITGKGTARHRASMTYIGLAAGVVLAILAAGTWRLTRPDGGYSTPIGGIASVPMTDGSRITLNTDSEVRVHMTPAERGIELTQGEAFFEVAKDPTRPFVVHVGSRRVIAVGTKFSVRRYGDDVEVVVTEGKVRLASAQSSKNSLLAHTSAVDSIELLTPGTIARASDSGVLIQHEALPEADERLGWRSGVLMLRNRTLADAIAEFNRYNVRKVVIADPNIAALKVEGNFRVTNVEGFVRLLESGFPVRVRQESDHIVLTAR
jgi:transmembrane sensor